MARRWSVSVWKAWLKEWQLIKHYWWFLAIGVIGELAHSWFSKFVYYLYGLYGVENQPVLVDLGYKAFDFIPDNLQYVPEVFEFTIMFCVVMFCLSPLVMKRDFYAIHLLNRFLIVTLSALVGRVVAFTVTILPSPAIHCRAGDPGFDPPTNAGEIFGQLNALDGCADLIYSGHTLFATAFFLMYYHYGKSNVIKVVMFMALIAMALMIIAAHHHYSVDVWLALFVTPWIYLTWETRWKDYKPPSLVQLEKQDEEEKKAAASSSNPSEAEFDPLQSQHRIGTEEEMYEIELHEDQELKVENAEVIMQA